MDDLPDHMKFGYEHLKEMEEITALLRSNGVTDPLELHFKADRIYMERHKNDVPYRDKRVQPSVRAQSISGLSPEEREFLLEYFAGANNPLVQGLLEKLK